MCSSANATPAFEGRGGEHLAAELSRFLFLAHSPVFNLSNLCIVPGQSCWKLFVDVLILECGGKDLIEVLFQHKFKELNIKNVFPMPF